MLVANGLVLAGIAWMSVVGTQHRATAVLPAGGDANSDVAALEAAASGAPTASAVARLAAAYLDREQPGLATAVIERAPAEVRQRPEIAQLHARALFGRGHARQALAVARTVHDSCDASAEGRIGCPPWLVAKSTHQLAFLEEVVAAGIDDPFVDPVATVAAYQRSNREIRIVAVR
jgi:hypothetical protein